ncbi:MAG: hypothetical protein QG550_453, partial [Pseudomonadota bacterium]|nr:hypothetical protein [Pseudomonadota bacterium]
MNSPGRLQAPVGASAYKPQPRRRSFSWPAKRKETAVKEQMTQLPTRLEAGGVC